jgi:hypothetical protein
MRAAIACTYLTLALVAPCTSQGATVEARDYDAFWLWAGVRPQPVLASAKVLYILQGEVTATSPARLISQRATTPTLRRGSVWLVYRVQTLDWTPVIYSQVAAHLRRWRAAGNPVVGVQIDFDARSRHLEAYAAFLTDLRSRLPPDCRLGVTGLLDWSSQGNPAGLDALAGVVDEVVLQTYQGRHTIPGYAAYLARLDRLRTPFRIGLVQGGEWIAPEGLARNANFRGYVVFLRNPPLTAQQPRLEAGPPGR